MSSSDMGGGTVTKVEARAALARFTEPLERLSQLAASGHRAIPPDWVAALGATGIDARPGEPIDSVIDRVWSKARTIVEEPR